MTNKYQVLEAGHQGDVLFLKVAELPPLHAKQIMAPDKKMGQIIHHGEALGHFHRAPNPTTLQVWNLGVVDSVKEMVLKVTAPTDIVHEEHATKTLSPGFWIARTQRENFRGMTRAVMD